ncbi:hypothetical protein HZU40_34030 (plasmid) [Mycolicibacterium fluoranthenivorans]|uniref:Uncharacterized protein n=1 Tax=Mycolicibacterium fluoranthenivorans TaxID=258505 RepID=A0A7G8PQD3_9MYCO|nr:hypothetical protein [Mycolicibacterium fluoranthenivorans]QNJ96549.1 hypothetical protein HZU40_34030 [Mycolicibacterium fluoranthenivorans]
MPDLPTPLSAMLELHPARFDSCWHPDPPALRRLRAAPSWLDCPTCSDPDHPKPVRCERRLINRRLDEIMGPAMADLAPGLLACHEALDKLPKRQILEHYECRSRA